MKTLLLAACLIATAVGCHNTCENGTGGDGGGSVGDCGFPAECDPTEAPHLSKEDCNDDNPVTADRCIQVGTNCGGVCAHVSVECDTLDPIEMQKTMCDDGDPCTEDRCGKSNVCDRSIIANCP